ncbi:hypothetical protein RSOLAG1IB_05076 [Rhizoctonia solani AG-1 IB]|uniref:Uncharacterized protein n=1 Tax=Thanatephorus cucumeris (strain AG1-IB / isolate 7/3/14) TaxID=1108050 RepID=M5CDT8_THACB|nr:hypothetical protein BN14_11585 [Rhizoctonia solani AG-1 IB]CEL62719.1 hypothetical protein RSOLAG1IB_05076 [Rhizoctonia solani AG-1 IB]
MGFFDDIEQGNLLFEEGSDTSSNVDEREAQFGAVGNAVPTTGCAFDSVDLSGVTVAPALLAFAEACCEEFKLPAAAKDDVARTAMLPGSSYMSIRLYARVIAIGQETTKSQVEDFLRSNVFKENIKRRIQGGLLDPNIPYYVRGCTDRFVKHMRDNPSSYEIPQVVQEGLMSTKKFSSAVAEILSGFRGELRRKIFGSIEDKTDIASTGEKLAIQGYRLSEDHLKRFALLRQLSEDYIEAEAEAQARKAMENASTMSRTHGRSNKKKLDGGPQKALALWTFVDAQMLRFQKYPVDKRTEILKSILRQDRKKYPDVTARARWYPPLSQLTVQQWQADASYAVQAMERYTLSAAQEGQEAVAAGLGSAGEDEDTSSQTDQPEEDGIPSDNHQGAIPQVGTSANTGFQDDPPAPTNNERARGSSSQYPEEDSIFDGTGPAPTRHDLPSSGHGSDSLSHRAQSGRTPQHPVQRGAPDSVGPVRGHPGPQGGRVITLAQTSRGSPFPSSSRSSTPQVVRTPTPTETNRGRVTRSRAGAQYPPVVEPYDPVGSETAAASVGV